MSEPSMAVRSPKLALSGRAATMSFGSVGSLPITDLVAAVLERFWCEYRRLHDGDTPERVILTHPAGWAGPTLKRLETAAAAAGLGSKVGLVAEPIAAAGEVARNGSSGRLAILDMGGGTTDIAILESTAKTLRLSGPPEGVDIGGELFDERLAGWLGTRFSAQSDRFKDVYDRSDRDGLRLRLQTLERARDTKEYLSTSQSVPTIAPRVADEVDEVTVTIGDLRKLIWDDLMTSMAGLTKAANRVDMAVSDLGSVQLAGGSSKMPLVAEAIKLTTGADPVITPKPKLAVCLGAARACSRLAA